MRHDVFEWLGVVWQKASLIDCSMVVTADVLPTLATVSSAAKSRAQTGRDDAFYFTISATTERPSMMNGETSRPPERVRQCSRSRCSACVTW